MENINLEEFTSKLNNLCISLQDKDKEIIDEDTYNKAKEIINNLTPTTSIDVLKYCASLNLLNTYVKQPGVKRSYFFKSKIKDVLLESIFKNKIDGVSYYYDNSHKNVVVYIKIYNIIFSFHNVNIKDDNSYILKSELNSKIVFDGVRKQQCALTIFNEIMKYSENK